MGAALARGYTGTQIFRSFGNVSEPEPDYADWAFTDGRWIRHGGGSTNASTTTLVVTGTQAKLQAWRLKAGVAEQDASVLFDFEMIAETGYGYSVSLDLAASSQNLYIAYLWNGSPGTMVSFTNNINSPPTAATPSISFVNQGGQYYAQITCATMGVTLQYNFNNSSPSTIYPSAVPCYGHSGHTLYAQACGHGYQPSALASVTVP